MDRTSHSEFETVHFIRLVALCLSVGVGATLRFPNPADIQDLYTLNFVGMKPRFVGTFLVLFPVIVMMYVEWETFHQFAPAPVAGE